MADTDILTVEDARTAINMPGGQHDSILQQLVTGISLRMDALCGPIVQRTVTAERHNGGCVFVAPRKVPVASITSVTEYISGTGTALTAETISTAPTSAYLLDDTLRFYPKIYRRDGGADVLFAAGRMNIAVTYEAGRYADTASVPENFKETARQILRRLWKREQNAWARVSNFDGDEGAPAAFFKAYDPVIKESLGDELLPSPSV